MQKAGAVIFSMLLGACGVGSDGGGGDDGPPPNPPDPNPLAMKCTDAFTITGTFAPTTARPADVLGCWGAGTWTFSLALDPSTDSILDVTGDQKPDRCGSVAGTSAATFKPSYSFTLAITTTAEGEYDSVYTFAPGQGIAADCTGAGDCLARLKVSQDGARECEGGIEIYSADRKSYWNLHPNQKTGEGNIAGVGEFTLYNEPQTP
jgi:hypothetical protein